MIDEHIRILTLYISTWAWHILAIMFFIQALNLLLIHNYVWMSGFVGVIIVCEVFAYLRQREVMRMIKNDK